MAPIIILRPLLLGGLLLALAACNGEAPSVTPTLPAISDGSRVTAGQPSTRTSKPIDASSATSERPAGAPVLGSCAPVTGGVDLCSDHSGPRFALRWTTDDGNSWSTQSFDVRRLLWGPVDSMKPRLLAAVGGSDGATLQPFEMVLRSDDLGETWQKINLPRFDGEPAFVAGSVVTRDGRLVSLLTEFTDDAPGWEADRPHGLYASAGSDWSAYAPVEADFTPELKPAPPGEPALTELSATIGATPLIRVRTWDDRVYVSSDQALTFRELGVNSCNACE